MRRSHRPEEAPPPPPGFLHFHVFVSFLFTNIKTSFEDSAPQGTSSSLHKVQVLAIEDSTQRVRPSDFSVLFFRLIFPVFLGDPGLQRSNSVRDLSARGTASATRELRSTDPDPVCSAGPRLKSAIVGRAGKQAGLRVIWPRPRVGRPRPTPAQESGGQGQSPEGHRVKFRTSEREN